MDWARTRDLRVAGCALLCAVAGAAWQADAALATYGKVTVVKQNVGGNPADAFGFTPNLYPAKPAFSLLGGEKKTYEIDCNVGTYCRPGTLAVTEDVDARLHDDRRGVPHPHGDADAFSSEPTDADPVDADTTLSGRTINLRSSSASG